MTDIKKLLYRLSIGQCTPAEHEELEKWAAGNRARLNLLRRLADPDYVAAQLSKRSLVSVNRPMADMRRFIGASRLRQRLKAFSIAAGVALIAGVAATYFIYSNGGAFDTRSGNGLVAEAHQDSISIEGILPGTTRAKLFSGTGTAIELNATDTALMSHDMLLPQDKDGRSEVSELCLDVPRGGEFKIMLEDSTEVWLNSESRLRYPEVFSADERRVQVEGEAYFIVKHDASRPFYVETKELTVRVYGTAFNVRAYDDDEFVYTTLEKGSIAIRRLGINSGELLLSPGHQASLNRVESKINMKIVDPAVITGWRHGRFVFEEQPLKNIMRDLARWYDFKYEFEDHDLENIVFMGSIPRYSNFSAAQHILEQSGDIELRTDGDRIIVAAKRK